MRTSGIYKIINKINNKIYVGQSIDIQERWYQHKYKAFDKNEIGYNSAIHLAMRKYGVENFSIEIIEECAPELLDERERFWIKKLNCLSPNGYNILEGGQKKRSEIRKCCDCGVQISKGATRCLSCARRQQQKKHNAEKPLTALQLAQAIKEKGFEQVGRNYNVSGNAIKKWCKAYNIPYRKAELIAWYNEQVGIVEKEKKVLKIPVNQLDLLTGEVLQSFESANAAARSLGREKGSHITEVCKGTHKQAYGFGWEYAINVDVV